MLKDQRCVPCEGGTPPLDSAKSRELSKEVPDWQLQENKISRTFKFKTFRQAVGFVQKVADVAESENHHPDFLVQYNKVTLTFWTHAIGGLSHNDFILAAKIDALPG